VDKHLLQLGKNNPSRCRFRAPGKLHRLHSCLGPGWFAELPVLEALARLRRSNLVSAINQKPNPVYFDVMAMYRAMDRMRLQRDLSWRQVAQELLDQSATLNGQRVDHLISPSTLTGIAKRGDCTCQHALFILRWLGLARESFLTPAPTNVSGFKLPNADPEHRLRWDLSELYAALNARRREEGLTWSELARQLRSSSNQLTGIKTARYAVGMKLAMRIVHCLQRPASSFIYAARW